MTEKTGSFVDTPETRQQLEHLELVAEWMDRRFLDPIIGIFFPGVGNTLCSLVGLYGVFVAARLKVHPVVLGRMLINLALDAFIGTIPILGWLVDFFYRAHVKNLRLLHERGERGEPTGGDWFFVLFAAGLFLSAVALPVIIAGLLLTWLLSLALF